MSPAIRYNAESPIVVLTEERFGGNLTKPYLIFHQKWFSPADKMLHYSDGGLT
jgi:hypothetical protein